MNVEISIYVTDDHNANPEEDWDDDSIHGSDEANSESRDSNETEIDSPISPVSRTSTFVGHNFSSENEKPRRFSVKGEKRNSNPKSQGNEMLSLPSVSTFVGRPDLGPILRDTVEGTVTGGEVSVHGMSTSDLFHEVELTRSLVSSLWFERNSECRSLCTSLQPYEHPERRGDCFPACRVVRSLIYFRYLLGASSCYDPFFLVRLVFYC